MAGSEYNLRMKNLKILSSGGDVAEQWQMLLALLQPIESRLPFPHTKYASLAGFILFQALLRIYWSNGIMLRSLSSYIYAENFFSSFKKTSKIS